MEKANQSAHSPKDSSLETIQQYREVAQQTASKVVQAAQDGYEHATSENTGPAKDTAADKTSNAKDAVAAKAGECTDYASEKMEQLKIGAQDLYNKTAGHTNGSASEQKAQSTNEGTNQATDHANPTAQSATDKCNQAADYASKTAQTVKECAVNKYAEAANYANQVAQSAKETAVGKYNETTHTTKQAAADNYNQASDYTQQTAQTTKGGAQDKYAQIKDATYGAINSAKETLLGKDGTAKKSGDQELADAGAEKEVVGAKEDEAATTAAKSKLQPSEGVEGKVDGGEEKCPKGILASVGESVSAVAQSVKKAIIGGEDEA